MPTRVWEYRSEEVRLPEGASAAKLNDLGADGWELVAAVGTKTLMGVGSEETLYAHLFFKRPVDDDE